MRRKNTESINISGGMKIGAAWIYFRVAAMQRKNWTDDGPRFVLSFDSIRGRLVDGIYHGEHLL